MISNTEFAPIAGKPLRLAPDLELVLAPNPSPMTFLGTNTYLIGQTSLAIIDPGPNDPAHLAALQEAISGRKVEHILLTHSHRDHSLLAKPLSAITGAPVLAFGDSATGRSAVMQLLAAQGLAGGGEGIDHGFSPDQRVADGEVIQGQWGEMVAHHTPGHMGNHLCFQWRDAVFTGDHIMDWASSLVSPPDGDLTDFMASCAKLRAHMASVYYPGHGAPITRPADRLEWLIDHRTSRETQILAALMDGPASVQDVTRAVYHNIAPALQAAAARNVLAHLIDLHGRDKVNAVPTLSEHALFGLLTAETET